MVFLYLHYVSKKFEHFGRIGKHESVLKKNKHQTTQKTENHNHEIDQLLALVTLSAKSRLS